MLDLIEVSLCQKGYRYQRLDGKKSLSQRAEAVELFNTDSTYTIMLATIGSAGEG